MPVLQASATLESSVIRRVKYDIPHRTLSIWFVGRRGAYRYYDVPKRVYEELTEADSPGRYFNEHIRDRYEFTH
ncbi:KTSC domain-containing protein [Sinorhizobium numidicum]|uniref:KTSC domain-containing protein n=1 Tax=Sinorhizobium numidicum TaxID=680248 RepID=A0ABY8CZ28_9HYPH|nr:KTSC domain-containing protein [Sinorhizobium numidicum]WEX77240.1 KTSC domain-containing protein [Sinorhizobium numidicum]WEX83899.1 KTSC domain-containing protein [Sinorhizobium numidicum]